MYKKKESQQTVNKHQKINNKTVPCHDWLLPWGVCTAWQTTCGDRHTLTVTTWHWAEGRTLKTRHNHILQLLERGKEKETPKETEAKYTLQEKYKLSFNRIIQNMITYRDR